MKNIITLTLTILALNLSAQTILKNIPIESDDAYEIRVWTLDVANNEWRWGDVYETGIERSFGWIYEQKINVGVERYDTFDLLFIRGGECPDTTRIIIHGNHTKTTIKDNPNVREVIRVNGKTQTFGTKVKRP